MHDLDSVAEGCAELATGADFRIVPQQMNGRLRSFPCAQLVGLQCAARGGFILAGLIAVLSLSAAGQVPSAIPQPTPESAHHPIDQGQLSVAFSHLPLSFEENKGQVSPSVRFLARGPGYGIYLAANQATLTFHGRHSSVRETGLKMPGDTTEAPTSAIRMILLGANSSLGGEPADSLPGKVNYFLGNDPAKWQLGVSTYARVRFPGVYPGIDAVYYGTQGKLEYDFVLAPGADPAAIRLRFEGARKLLLGPDGGLSVVGDDGALAFHRPAAYQELAGSDGSSIRETVAGDFQLVDCNTIQFTVGKFDRSRPLVIDPILTYSTYLGGSTSDSASALAVDASGNAYLAGLTFSTDFPVTSGAYDKTDPSSQPANWHAAFLSKINAAGTALVYSTYLGGTGHWPSDGDSVAAIALDSQGNAYLTGTATSPDFPVTQGAFQTIDHELLNSFAMNTAFVTKLSADGSKLIYSTFLGGSGQGDTDGYGDEGQGIAVDGLGNAYVTGTTESDDFPITPGSFQPQNASLHSSVTGGTVRGGNAFVTKLNPAGIQLVYSTYLGGSLKGMSIHGVDAANGIKVDASGSAFVAGIAESNDFPVTAGALQTQSPMLAPYQATGFVTKLKPDGSGLVYSTYLGGKTAVNSTDYYLNAPSAIAIDSSGNAYVGGSTVTADFPTTSGAYQRTLVPGGVTSTSVSSGFVSKLNSTGSKLVYSTYLGGSTGGLNYLQLGGIRALAINGSGNAIVAGATSAIDFPTTTGAVPRDSLNSKYQTTFLARLNAAGTALGYSTYLSGSGATVNGNTDSAPEAAEALAVDGSGNAFVAGYTFSADFPVTAGAFQVTNHAAANSGGNAFLAKLGLASSAGAFAASTTKVKADVNPQLQGDPVTFTATVLPLSGSGAPTGSVTFYVDGVSADTVPLSSGGTAIWPTSNIGAGSHAVFAAFSGNSSFVSSGGQVVENIKSPVASVVAISGSGQTSVYGTQFPNPLIIELEDLGGNPVPNIVVNFSGSGLKFSSPAIASDANGKVQVSVTPTAAGFFTATASVTAVTSQANFSLSANRAPLTVAANSQSKKYGSAVPALTYTLTGFINGDTQASATTGSPKLTTTATSKSIVGSYPISVSLGTLNSNNYSFLTKNGTLTVSKATLNLTAKSESMTYGAAVPALAYTVAGFVNGDTQTSATTGAPLLKTLVTSKTAAGPHPITISAGTMAAKNYALSFINGVVTVNKAPLKITVNSATRLYGASNPAFTGKVTGLLNGDVITTTYSTTATKSSPVGTDPITATISGAVSGNYAPTVTKGILTIAKAPLKIAVKSATRVYGTNNPVLSGTVTGILNGDIVTVTYSTTATKTSPVGTYPITATISGAASGNYTAIVTKGTLTISKAVAATPVFKPAGGTYTVHPVVTLTDTSAGVTFYYTINGSVPSTSSTKYTGPITVSTSETLKAIALSGNYSQSAVATAVYVLK